MNSVGPGAGAPSGSSPRSNSSLRVRFPQGSEIWNASTSWVNVTLLHPAGVVSNVNGRAVKWADVNYVSLESLYAISLVAYPVLLVCLLLLAAVLVSVCVAQDLAAAAPGAASRSGGGFGGSVAEVVDELSPRSRFRRTNPQR